MTAPVTFAMITRGEDTLEACIRSVRPHVAEIVLAFCAPPDAPLLRKLRKLADRVETHTECLDEDGNMLDFGAARRFSFGLATQPFVTWADSDDDIKNAQALPLVIDTLAKEPQGRIVSPYEYALQPDSEECVLRQYRERIVRNDGLWTWRHRVHEHLVRADNEPPVNVRDERVVWQHRKTLEQVKAQAGRNLRILRAAERDAATAGEELDLWTVYCLGEELAHAGQFDEAMGYLTRYVMMSDRDDERVMAMLRLSDCAVAMGKDPLPFIKEAENVRPKWFETFYAEAKHWLLQAAITQDQSAARRAIEIAQYALTLPSTETPLAVDPTARGKGVRDLLRAAHDFAGTPKSFSLQLAALAASTPSDAGLQLAAVDAAGGTEGAPDVIIVCARTMEAWDPAKAAREGVGGSETAVIELAKRLRATGARVRVFARIATPGLYDGVEYWRAGESTWESPPDLLIAWRDAEYLEIAARVKWLWCHDVVPHRATKWNLHLADRILCVSEWHAADFRKRYPEVAEKVTATRNGLDYLRFEPPPAALDASMESTMREARDAKKVLYTSSSDRGLPELLDLWPLVHAREPGATLHVFYGGVSLDMQKRMEGMKALGVVYRGRVDQKTLALEMLSAGVWVHPSWHKDKAFTETACLGAREAQAAGLVCIAGPYGALTEAIQNIGFHTFVDGDPREKPVQEKWVRAITRAMKSDESDEGMRAAIRAAAGDYDWDTLAISWKKMVDADVAESWRKQVVVAGAADDDRPVLHMLLTKEASGGVVMDAANPGGEAMGGGSRVGFLGLTEAMGKRGSYRIVAFSTFKDPLLVRDGIEYRQIDTWASVVAREGHPAAMLAFYDTSPLQWCRLETLRIGSNHTFDIYPYTQWSDVVTAPSAHALAAIRERFGKQVPEGASWHVLPNGIPRSTIQRTPVPGRALYHTSADRALHVLLSLWPLVKERVKGATLHVVGPLDKIVEGDVRAADRMSERILALQGALARAHAAGGVKLLGRLTRADLDVELGEAKVFPFWCDPIRPSETFSLSVGECLAAGIPCVLRPADSLESLWGRAVLIAKTGDAFVDGIVRVMADPELAADLSERGKKAAEQYTFEREAEVLDALIQKELARKLGLIVDHQGYVYWRGVRVAR